MKNECTQFWYIYKGYIQNALHYVDGAQDRYLTVTFAVAMFSLYLRHMQQNGCMYNLNCEELIHIGFNVSFPNWHKICLNLSLFLRECNGSWICFFYRIKILHYNGIFICYNFDDYSLKWCAFNEVIRLCLGWLNLCHPHGFTDEIRWSGYIFKIHA